MKKTIPTTRPGQGIDLRPKEIPQERIDELARPLIEKVRHYFEDPAVAAEYEVWLANRKRKKPAVV